MKEFRKSKFAICIIKNFQMYFMRFISILNVCFELIKDCNDVTSVLFSLPSFA